MSQNSCFAWKIGVKAMKVFNFAFCLSVIFAVPLDVLSQEQACTDLGANCICSDPMGANEGGAFINNGHDFSDSPDTIECMGNRTGVGSFGTSGTNKHTMQAVTDWGDVAYALNQKANGGFIWINGANVVSGSLALDSGDKTICYRYYKQVDSNYSNAGTGSNCENRTQQRNKFFQSTWSGGGSGPAFSQSTEMALNDCPDVGSYLNFGTTLPTGPQQGAYAISPSVKFNDCMDKPCRFEYCIDGDLSTGKNITHRFRVHSMDTGVTGTAILPSTNMSGGPSEADKWGGDVFHSGPSGDARHGYFMEARWDTDTNQWIGPACEIEGGCSTLEAPSNLRIAP